MLLKINSLLIKRGNKILIRDFNLIIQKSQIIAISGSNGIGKSTLLETISGLQKNYDGEINFFIQDKINEGLNRSSFFFLGHLNALKDELCVLDNLKIQTNLIETAWEYDVKRLLFLGSSCIYPKFAKQPIKEENHA